MRGGGITDKFVSIRELYQPTKEDVNWETGNFSGIENCDRVTEIEFQSPSSYETVNGLIVGFMNVGISAALSLIMRTTDNDTRLVWARESADTGLTSGVIFTITPEGTTSFNEEEFAKFNGYLSVDDFRYIVANNGKGFTDAEFDTLDKFIKVKTV